MLELKSCCKGKEQFSKPIAKEVARRVRERRDAKVIAYRCDLCGHYHIGSTIIKRTDRR